mmetsp:Transcript_7127/g.14623  ORF Transcript_7127/g.14623 Transcript_7127/m.14623 type:complete len:205 (+) Transcript_7127:217-831(+)|eukprot:CAMPEP_0168732342 /NCGR_PEP_ID=MMETSP0724-20121128/7723_1 /TAXON_ID=265536 /ORGANISM="Amphiprora sp., Strain CCMP467" /LENGTH=204 /DNA_ID=CAMNT_0008779361 /DNA_START=209 /DNA_END=823 /DNA_ORIENTATION=-
MGVDNQAIVMWDGIMTVTPTAGSNGNFDISWTGTVLVHEGVADPSAVGEPPRPGSALHASSDKSFTVTGTAVPCDGVADGNKFKKYLVEITGGEGFELGDGSKHQDKKHQIITSLQWRGAPDGSESLCYGQGEDEFGLFVSLGYMKPGNRITLARRTALDSADERTKWTVQDVEKKTLAAIYDEEEEDITCRPPWKSEILKIGA